jgi:hypothetical protein
MIEDGALRKEYESGTSWVGIAVGGVGVFLGLFQLLIFDWRAIGGFAIAFGALLILSQVFGTDRTMVCTPDGVSLDTSSRLHGKTHQMLAWSEITETRYYKRNARDSYGYAVFEIYDGPRRLFSYSRDASQGMQGFAELVELSNAMTVHLPYVWKLVDQQKSVYAKMDRVNAGSEPSPLPPPIPQGGQK